MNPLLLALKDGAKTYGELRTIPNIDSLIRLARKRLEVVLVPGSPVRFALFRQDRDPPKEKPAPKPKRRVLTLEGPTKTCTECGETKRITQFGWHRIVHGKKQRKRFCYPCERIRRLKLKEAA